MKIKRLTKKNLEFLTNQLKPEEPLKLKKKANTFLFYEEKIEAIVHQSKRGGTQRVELTRYGPEFSIKQVLPLLRTTKYLELPREENLEELLQLMSYEKIKEEKGYETYKLKREVIHGLLNLGKAFKTFNVKQQFKDYFQLWRDEPEFGFYELAHILANASSGALLGAVMPSFWDYGGAMKLAGVLAAIQKVVTPVTNVLTSGSMGKVVDKATGDTSLQELKGLQKKIGGLYIFMATDGSVESFYD